MQTDSRIASKEIERGRIKGLDRTYQIVEKENGEIYVNTLNSWFRIARSYADFKAMSRDSIDRLIYEEEMAGEGNMRDLYGSSMGR